MKNKLLAISALLLLSMLGCYNDKGDQLYVPPLTVTCDTTAVSYAKVIAPIFATSCNISGGCHDAAGQSTSGYNFITYSGILPIATTAVLVYDVNGNPSQLHAMPKNLPQLSACDINKITAWVNQGALNN